MISLKYAKDILNFLFATDGTNVSYEEELAQLRQRGIKTQITGLDRFNTVPQDGDTEEEELEKLVLDDTYKEYEKAINETVWCATMIDTATAYEEKKNVNGMLIKKTHYGYVTYKLSQPRTSAKYPTKRYLALFTTMPDEDGADYVEPPFKNDENKDATYCRVDLDTGYFTRDQVMNDAQADAQNGGAYIDNKSTIYYPEISGNDWGEIVGFGIFENKDPIDDEIPFLWGTLSNGPVNATKNHVPLFRTNEFKISIS